MKTTRLRLTALACVLALVTAVGCAPLDSSASGTAAATRATIVTEDAPAAIGPYSQAVRVGDTLYLSGQIGFDPRTGQMVEGGIEPETRQVLANLDAVLKAGGFSRADVVQAKVFLADLNDYAAMNTVYSDFFGGGSFPARAAVQVARVPRDARVEIMFTAVRTGER